MHSDTTDRAPRRSRSCRGFNPTTGTATPSAMPPSCKGRPRPVGHVLSRRARSRHVSHRRLEAISSMANDCAREPAQGCRDQLRIADRVLAEIGMEGFAARGELLATGETARKRTVDTGDDSPRRRLRSPKSLGTDVRTRRSAPACSSVHAPVERHLRKVLTGAAPVPDGGAHLADFRQEPAGRARRGTLRNLDQGTDQGPRRVRRVVRSARVVADALMACFSC